MLTGGRVGKGESPQQSQDRQRPGAGPAPAPSGGIGALQRTIGNRAVLALLAAGQPKLRVGAADDRYEREADAVAGEVLSRLGGGLHSGGGAAEGSGGGHRHDHDHGQHLDEEETPVGRMVSRLQRKAKDPIGAEGGDLDSETETTITAARTGGQSLPGGTRRSMEGAFGANFSGVRVHRGEQAAALNDAVGARAFTVGSDIFLGRSTPDLASPGGQSLIAHELTHTIQQGAARIDERD